MDSNMLKVQGKIPSHNTWFFKFLAMFEHELQKVRFVELRPKIYWFRATYLFLKTHWRRLLNIQLQGCHSSMVFIRANKRNNFYGNHLYSAIFMKRGFSIHFICLELLVWVEPVASKSITSNNSSSAMPSRGNYLLFGNNNLRTSKRVS